MDTPGERQHPDKPPLPVLRRPVGRVDGGDLHRLLLDLAKLRRQSLVALADLDVLDFLTKVFREARQVAKSEFEPLRAVEVRMPIRAPELLRAGYKGILTEKTADHLDTEIGSLLLELAALARQRATPLIVSGRDGLAIHAHRVDLAKRRGWSLYRILGDLVLKATAKPKRRR